MKVGDVEEEKRKKVHDEGYEVPLVTMRMETVDSDEDFEQPPPSQVAFTLHRVRDEDGLMDVLHRDRGRVRSELRRNGTRGASTLMVGARTRVGRELRRLNQRHAGSRVENVGRLWRKERGGLEKVGRVWRKLVGIWRKGVVVVHNFAPTHTCAGCTA